MAEEEEPTNLTQRTRPALLTYQKKKPRFPSTTPHSQQLFKKLREGEICSYCLQNKPDDLEIDDDMAKLESLNCFKCSRRVHFCCIPREHRHDFVTWQNLGKPGNGCSFTCVDCSTVPKSLVKNKNMSVLDLISKEKVADVSSGDLLEKRVDDKDLAIQLHLEMNGSHRVSRKEVHSGLVSGPGKAKRGELELYRQRWSLGSIGVKNSRIINARFDGISVGLNSVVLALECTKCLYEPLSELGERCRILKKYSKRKKVQNDNGDSVLESEIGGEKNGNKYDKKKEAFSIPTGNNSHSQSASDRYQKKYAKRKRTLEGIFAHSGRQNGSKRYVNKYYKRRSCLKKLVDSNGTETMFDHNVGFKKNMADRFLNKYFKRRQLSVTREDGTCVGTRTAYDQNESDRYLKKYSKTRKRKPGSGGEQCGIDRYMKKYRKRHLSL